jgi:hypothetical protein
MSKTIAILQSNYIPWKGYFDIIAKSNVFVIYDEVQFTKNDWRNRNLIKTPIGVQWLTIPVRQESLHQKIYETKVFQVNWHKKHLRTLQANYSKAKFFSEYKDRLFTIYDTESLYLSEINKLFIKGICDLLEIKTPIIDSRELELKGDRTEKLIDACKKLNAKTYLSGPSAQDYINKNLFKEENIDIEWIDYSGYPEYHQLYPPFEHRVTTLDLIFNEGKNARSFMKHT